MGSETGIKLFFLNLSLDNCGHMIASKILATDQPDADKYDRQL
jgi:hypothetical protein